MTDREKLVEMINHVSEWHVENLMQPGGAEALADYLIAHGVTVKGLQKPLSLEELSYVADMYWMEVEDYCSPVLLSDKSYCYTSFSQIETGQEAFMNNDDYGKIWRCWAEKPTEEERKAAEWES